MNAIEQGTAPTLMAARDIDGKEGWVLGGTLSLAMELRAWHTLDTGKTFANAGKGTNGVSVMTTDFASRAHGYALPMGQLPPELLSLSASYKYPDGLSLVVGELVGIDLDQKPFRIAKNPLRQGLARL